MSWTEKKISDLGEIITGKTPSTKVPEFFGGDYPFVTPSDIEYGHYYARNTETTVTEFAKSKHRNQFVPKGSVLFTCIGNTMGKCAIAAQECLTNQQINAVVANNDNDPKFLYYLLHHSRNIVRGIGMGGGAATPIINKTTFGNVRLRLPTDKTTQEAISAILSQYDDLIENNKRRIELLEDSARQLYKEWFVRFRFPGHEHVKIIDGVPEGWKYRPLIEIAEMTMGQSPKSEFYNIDGIGTPFHQGVSNFGFRFVTHETYCTQPTRLSKAGDILFSVRAPVGRINITNDVIVLGRGLAAIRSNAGYQSFLFYALKSHFFKEDMIGGGAIYAAVTKKDMETQELLIPTDNLLQQFEEFASDIDKQIQKLDRMSENLTKARDILLPKLMSGEIAV